MKKIIGYLLLWLIAAVFFAMWQHLIELPQWYLKNMVAIRSILMGSTGGILYCTRAVYLNKCVRKSWDKEWEIWYYLRPIASGMSGFVSYIFLRAGLLVLESSTSTDATSLGYLAIAFIAGYNVDNFMKKLEEVAASVWGIKKSRVSEDIK